MLNAVGVSSLVAGTVSLDEAIQRTDVPGLFVLPGPSPSTRRRCCTTKAFQDLTALDSVSISVLLDSPPNVVADAAVLAAQSDGVVLVVRAHQTREDAARRALRTLRTVRARVLGVGPNAADLPEERGGYYGQRAVAPTGVRLLGGRS